MACYDLPANSIILTACALQRSMRPSQILAVLEREFAGTLARAHTPVMLWGPPGIGKSQLVRAVAERHGVRLIDVRLSQMEPADLRGIPFRHEGHVIWSVPALLPDCG